MTNTTRPTIALDAAGYVAGARCGLGHSGNQRLVPADRRAEHYQCCGCGRFYSAGEVAAPADQENGSGGVITR